MQLHLRATGRQPACKQAALTIAWSSLFGWSGLSCSKPGKNEQLVNLQVRMYYGSGNEVCMASHWRHKSQSYINSISQTSV